MKLMTVRLLRKPGNSLRAERLLGAASEHILRLDTQDSDI